MKHMNVLGALLLPVLTLVACADNTESYLLPDVAEIKSHRTVAKTIEIARFDLPAYAEDSQVSLLNDDGAVRPQKDVFWADAPDRALTEMLSAGLDRALAADVVSEPWPFNEPADIKIEVRVRDLIGTTAGSLKFTGQYSFSSPIGGNLQQSHRFRYEIPTIDGSLSSMADAQSRAVQALTQDIAHKLSHVRRSQISY